MFDQNHCINIYIYMLKSHIEKFKKRNLSEWRSPSIRDCSYIRSSDIRKFHGNLFARTTIMVKLQWTSLHILGLKDSFQNASSSCRFCLPQVAGVWIS